MALWYLSTAVHMWRFYFRYKQQDPDTMTVPNRENWKACDRAIKCFNDQEVELINKYFMTGYGNYEDLDCISGYISQKGLKPKQVWDVIKKANYTVIVERGLMDRKEGDIA